MVLHHECFHIRKSPDQCLFAAPRSLSQLVTSFIGSWCQGIHLMLLFAWTSYLLVLVLLNCLSFINSFLFFRISFAVKRFDPFHFLKLFYSTFRWNCSLPKFLERPILISLKFVLFYLFVSTLLLHLLFGFQWTLSLSGFFPWKLFSFATLVAMVGTSGLEPPTSRLSGARSNHLSYAPMWLNSVSRFSRLWKS